MNTPASLRPELRDYLMGGAVKPLLLIGDRNSGIKEDAVKAASFILSEEKPELSQDYMYIGLAEDSKTLGVDDAARIAERAAILPSKSPKQVILVDEFNTMTVPAQNKLLKLLEEPGTVLVIAVAYEDNVLATVKSRMQVITYRPLSLAQFEKHCADNGIGDPQVMYFMTGGMTGCIEEIDREGDLFKAFFEAYESAKKGTVGIMGVLTALHMVKEKDKQAFFENHRGYAGKMLSLVTYGILKAKPDAEESAYIMSAYKKEKERVSSVSYTKDDFFNFFVSL